MLGAASTLAAEHETLVTSDQPAAEEVVETLPPEIATVRTVGWWSEADQSGTYRLVITQHGFDKVVSRLFLQWLEPEQEGGSRVVSTVGFDELNEVPLYQLEVTEIRPLNNALEVELEGTSLYTGESLTFLLRAGSPGTATLNPKP